MTDVFISYARKDRNRVRLIAHGLAAEGFAVWWDPEIRPGAKWNATIRKALESAAAVVTVWSKTSAKSDWVLAETTHASGRHALVPAMIQRCDPPLPYNMIQSADLTAWRGDGEDAEWRTLLSQVRALVEAKRRMALGAPPPGEAQGAMRNVTAGAPGLGDPGGFENLHYRPSAVRQGPRWAKMAMGAVVATAVISAGIWAAPSVMDMIAPPPPAPQISAPPAPTATETVAPPASAAPPAAEIPLEAPLPPEPVPVAPPSPPPETATPAPPPRPTPTLTETPPSPAPVEDPAAVIALDTCVNRLVAMCPNATGEPAAGFASDRRLAGAERTFLIAQMIAADGPITADVAAACASAVQERSSSRTRNRNSLFESACRQVRFPQPLPPPPPPPPEQTAPPRVTTVQPTQPSAETDAVGDMVARPPTRSIATTNLTAQLDACLSRMAAACVMFRPDGYPEGFASDGRFSAAELQLLQRGRGFPSPGRTTQANLDFCNAAVRQGEGGDIPSTPLAIACSTSRQASQVQ